MNINTIKAGYYETGTKVFNFTKSPYFRPLMMAVLIALPLLSACSEGAQDIIAATSTPHVDPVATSLPDILNADVCRIIEIPQLGADAQGVNFPNAIPEGGQMIMQCGDEIVHAQLHYDDSVFGTTTFINDGVNRMAGIGDTVHTVGRDMNGCSTEAFAAPVGNGGSEYHQLADINAGDKLIQITTVGNSRSILEAEQNTTPAGFSIEPESLAGAGGPPYETGYSAFGWFSPSAEQVIEGVKHMILNFKGIFNPNQQCPAFTDQLDQ